jgi:NAD(P)-dependent dehydrogenase (short-subunit alcohol dehydrogenase family)
MDVLVVGATGLIGTAISHALEAVGDRVIRAGRSGGDISVDLGDPESVRAAVVAAGEIDAIVCAAGIARFGILQELDSEGYESSFSNKFMGQVNLVRFGLGRVRSGGSFTLTSGTLSTSPSAGSVAVAAFGAAVEGFARAAALDLDGEYRVNAVSPGWVAESRQAAGLDPMPGIWAADLARYYVRSVHGDATGAVWEAEGPLT